MFFVKSLNNKITNSISQFEVETEPKQCAFPYVKKPSPPELLLAPKRIEESSVPIEELTMKERQKRFTISKLREKWKEKMNVNFDRKFKKFSTDCINDRAKTAKQYVKELVVLDVFANQKQRWNIGTKPNAKYSTIPDEEKPLDKTLFNITQGLGNYHVVPLKDQSQEGTDLKYHPPSDYDTRWNKTTKLEDFEKRDLQMELGEKAMNNNMHHWKKTISARRNEEEFTITEERKKVENSRHYNKYKDPLELTQYNYDKMKEAKEKLWIETEATTQKVRHENPGCDKLQEKINSIVRNQMANAYKEQFDLLTGKRKMKESERRNYVWKDEEIIDKINTIQNWDDVTWFKPSHRPLSQYPKEIDSMKRQELLKPLITRGVEIFKEENSLKEKKKSELKKEMKNQLLQQRNNNNLPKDTISTHLTQSKYPIGENEYMDIVKTNSTQQQEEAFEENQKHNEYPQENRNHCFLEAYKKVIIESKEKERKKEKKGWITYTYSHPGTYREFVIEEKDLSPKKNKKEVNKAWSCCMSTIESSRGCSKQAINHHRWNLDHF